VQRRGYVADIAEAGRVARVVRSIPGVMQVDRQLITDDDMALAVTDAMRTNPATRGADVQVSAYHATVDITGTAPDRAAARRIEALVNQVTGAQVVHNMVAVPQPLL